MTREEAIRIAQGLITNFKCESETMVDFCNVVIKALKQEPCEDCISRQAVDELSEALVHTTINKADFVCNFWERLQKLPPVIPKEKTGYWIEDLSEYDNGYPKHIQAVWKCSECEQKQVRKSNYCPNCGVRMIEPQESEVGMSVKNGKVCCNCRHNIRKHEIMFQETFINCYCDIDNHYIGYVECMEGWCRHWAKERKEKG